MPIPVIAARIAALAAKAKKAKNIKAVQMGGNRFGGKFGAEQIMGGFRGGPSRSDENDRDPEDPEREKKEKKQGSIYDTYNNLKNTKKIIDIALKLARVVPPQVWIIIGVIVLILILYMMLFSGGSNLPFSGGGSEEEAAVPGGENLKPIPGLTIQIGGEEFRENGQVITYPITISYNESISGIPPEEITLFDVFPTNTELESATPPYKVVGNRVEWRLSDVLSIQNLRISLRPTASNIVVVNKISATTTRALQDGSSGLSSNICTQPHEAGGYCSVENLKQYFNGDESKALSASLICKLESGGNPFVQNTNCATNDYSIGLFQINLVAHCPGAYAGQRCENLISESTRLACTQEMLDPSKNIQKMVSLSQDGTSFTVWSTWGAAQQVLRSCGQL